MHNSVDAHGWIQLMYIDEIFMKFKNKKTWTEESFLNEEFQCSQVLTNNISV